MFVGIRSWRALAAKTPHKFINPEHRIQGIEIKRGAFNQRGITIG
jgi:hypothetical protein